MCPELKSLLTATFYTLEQTENQAMYSSKLTDCTPDLTVSYH